MSSGFSGVNLSLGKLAINCSPQAAPSFLHRKLSLRTQRTADRPLIIQYNWRTLGKTYSWPGWPPSWWCFSMIKFVTLWRQGRIKNYVMLGVIDGSIFNHLQLSEVRFSLAWRLLTSDHSLKSFSDVSNGYFCRCLEISLSTTWT